MNQDESDGRGTGAMKQKFPVSAAFDMGVDEQDRGMAVFERLGVDRCLVAAGLLVAAQFRGGAYASRTGGDNFRPRPRVSFVENL
jgi:hypothetical protein